MEYACLNIIIIIVSSVDVVHLNATKSDFGLTTTCDAQRADAGALIIDRHVYVQNSICASPVWGNFPILPWHVELSEHSIVMVRTYIDLVISLFDLTRLSAQYGLAPQKKIIQYIVRIFCFSYTCVII